MKRASRTQLPPASQPVADPAFQQQVRERIQFLESECHWFESLLAIIPSTESEAVLQNVSETFSFNLEQLRRRTHSVAQELAQARYKHQGMVTELGRVEEEKARFASQYAEFNRQFSRIASLYVTSYHLHESLDKHRLWETIREIILNLVGSQQVAIFVTEPDKPVLTLALVNGVDIQRLDSIPLGTGLIGQAALSGRMLIREPDDGLTPLAYEQTLTACIPLKLNEAVIGAIALFALLPQKNGFEPVDHEIFELLSTHGAMALYYAHLHASTSSAVQLIPLPKPNPDPAFRTV